MEQLPECIEQFMIYDIFKEGEDINEETYIEQQCKDLRLDIANLYKDESSGVKSKHIYTPIFVTRNKVFRDGENQIFIISSVGCPRTINKNLKTSSILEENSELIYVEELKRTPIKEIE